MERIEITTDSIDRFDEVAESMAGAYQRAFRGEPWYEVSRCISPDCYVGFSSCDAGQLCEECGGLLDEAYSAQELVADWRDMLINQDACMELALDQQDRVSCATIARPTGPSELAVRKYVDNENMAEWIDDNLPRSFVWIEDTFANLDISPRGNLAERRLTLARIALRYNGADIATRTIAPQIIKATLRDVGSVTDMYVGARGVGRELVGRARNVRKVPDKRTLLVVAGKELV